MTNRREKNTVLFKRYWSIIAKAKHDFVPGFITEMSSAFYYQRMNIFYFWLLHNNTKQSVNYFNILFERLCSGNKHTINTNKSIKCCLNILKTCSIFSGNIQIVKTVINRHKWSWKTFFVLPNHVFRRLTIGISERKENSNLKLYTECLFFVVHFNGKHKKNTVYT